MPFISGLIAAVGSVITGIGAWAAGLGVVGKALLSFGLSMGLSALAGAIGGNKQPAAKPGEIAATLQVGGDIPRQVVFGLVGLKGQLVFAGTMGSSSEQLVQDHVLSDGWCDGLAGLWIGDQRQTLRLASQTGGISHYVVDAYGTTWDGEPLVQLWFFDGRPGQPASSQLTAYFGDHFSADDRFAGLCHVVTRVININDTFDSIPDWLFELRGYRCHDPRKDPAFGGSGSHAAADASTWEYSENPAIHAWNYLRGIESEGQVFMGLGVADYDLLTETFQQTATICDEQVPLDAGGSEARYRASTVLLAGDADHRAALAPLVQAMAGYLIERGGAFGLVAGAAQLPVETITDEDIVWSRGVKWSGSKSRTERTNEVHGQYVDPAAGWQANSYPAVASAIASAEDGERLAVKLDFGSITSVTQAQRAARIRLRETRRQASGSLTLGMHLLWLEPGDWIRWTSAKFNQDRLYRVVSRELNPDDTSSVQLREIGNEVFSWSTADEQPYAPFPTPEPGPPLPSTVSNFAVQPDVLTGADGTARPIMRLTWEPIADSRIVAVIIEYRIIGTIPATRVRDDSPWDGEFILDQPPTGFDYEFRASIATIPARPVSWTAWVSVPALRSIRWKIDYEDLKAGIRYRTSLIPDLSPLFDLVAENQVEALLGSRLAETGIRKTEQVKTDLTQAIAVTREELAAQIASDRAYVEETKIALLDADQALAAKQETFDVQLGESRSAIQQEAIARANAVSALAQSFDSYKASINGRMATAESGIQALANQQGAFAQQLTSLNASFGGFTAGGKVQFAAVAAPSGVFARYAVVLNASNGSRYESGLYYELIQSGASFYSQFFIDASRFYIGNPLTRTVPFAVVDGVTYIDNAVIRSGSLSRHAFGAGTTSASASIPIQPDGQVIAQVVYAGSQTLANGEAGFIYVYRNGTLIKQQTVDTHQIAVSGGNILRPMAIPSCRWRTTPMRLAPTRSRSRLASPAARRTACSSAASHCKSPPS